MIKRFLIAVLLLVVTANAYAAVTLAVRPDTIVDGKSVLLGSVASISGASSEFSRKLAAAQVCSSPSPGKQRTLTKTDLIIAIRRAGEDPRSVELICPEKMTVTRSSAHVSGQTIMEAIKTYALQKEWYGEAAVEPVRIPPDTDVPSGSVDFRVRTPAQSPKKGLNNLTVDILVDGKVEKSVTASATIRVVAPVLVATEAIRRGTPISASNTAMQRMDITNMPDDLVRDNSTDGWTALVPVQQGTVIRSGWVSAPAAVHAGDTVSVMVVSGLVKITEAGTAAQDGCVGDTIKVRLTGGMREVRGRIDAPGIVRIPMDGR